MEKRKQRDSKTTSKKYSTTNSRSWAGEVPRKTSLQQKNANKTASFSKTMHLRKNEHPLRTRRPDPTVPHLKYGLFPKKSDNREQFQVLSPNLTGHYTQNTPQVIVENQNEPDVFINNETLHRDRPIVEKKMSKPDRQSIGKTANTKTVSPKVQGETTECPTFVFRPLPHRNLQKLTVSASTHLDIRPKPTVSPQGNRKYLYN